MQNEKLDALIRDIEKVIDCEKILKDLETIQNMEGNIGKIINYGYANRIICSLDDILYVAQQLPLVKNALVEEAYKYEKRAELVKAKEICISSPKAPYQFNGKGYQKLSDIPGYRTKWNERCLPDELYRSNQRC